MEHGGDSQPVGHIGPCYETVHKRTTRAMWTSLFDHYVIEVIVMRY